MGSSATRRRAAQLLIACAVAACQPFDVVVVPIDGGAGSGGSAGSGGDGKAGSGGTIADAASDAARDAGPDAAPDAGDAGPVPGICLEGSSVAELREGDLPAALVNAPPALPSAICSCRGIASGDALVTDVWGGGAGGDVALNGEGFNLEADSAIAGSLIAAGAPGVSLMDDVELSVGGNLAVGGTLLGAASVDIGGNAMVGDRIELANLRVSGTLTQPQGAVLTISGTSDLGAQQSGEVMVPAPCPCAPNQITDVTAIVLAALPTTMPAQPHACPWPASGSPPRALFVPGDLSLRGDLVIGAGPGEDLVLLVAGNVLVEGRLELGSVAHGRRVHLYVGGNGTVQLGSGGTVAGAVYAPNAVVVFRQPLTVYGALFASRVSAESSLTVHDDPSLR